MNNHSHPHDFENLEPPLDAAVKAIVAEPVPDEAVQRVKTRAKQLAKTSTFTLPQMHRSHRHGWKRIVQWSGLATAVLLLMGAISLRGVWDGSGSAFAQVAENIKRSTSVSLRCHYMRTQAGKQSSDSVIAYVQGDVMRLEVFSGSVDANPKALPDKTLGIDLKQRSGWEIDSTSKTYKRFDLNDDAIKLFGKPMDSLTQLTNKDAELIGNEALDGQKVRVYRLLPGDFRLQDWKIEQGDIAKIWVDAESSLPVRIEGDFFDPTTSDKVHALYDQIEWNKPVDPKMFQLEVPAGFKAIEE